MDLTFNVTLHAFGNAAGINQIQESRDSVGENQKMQREITEIRGMLQRDHKECEDRFEEVTKTLAEVQEKLAEHRKVLEALDYRLKLLEPYLVPEIIGIQLAFLRNQVNLPPINRRGHNAACHGGQIVAAIDTISDPKEPDNYKLRCAYSELYGLDYDLSSKILKDENIMELCNIRASIQTTRPMFREPDAGHQVNRFNRVLFACGTLLHYWEEVESLVASSSVIV